MRITFFQVEISPLYGYLCLVRNIISYNNKVKSLIVEGVRQRTHLYSLTVFHPLDCVSIFPQIQFDLDDIIGSVSISNDSWCSVFKQISSRPIIAEDVRGLECMLPKVGGRAYTNSQVIMWRSNYFKEGWASGWRFYFISMYIWLPTLIFGVSLNKDGVLW